MTETFVDVAIPTSGEAAYLEAALCSVIAQTHENWRAYVTFHGDGRARDVVAAVGDPRITCADGALGAAANHNAAFRAGSGELVGVLHDDDLWDAKFLERRVEFMQREPSCGLVYGGCTLIDESGNEVGRTDPPSIGLLPPERFIQAFLRKAVPMPPTTVIRRSAFEAIGGAFDERFVRYDYELYVRIGLRFSVGYLPDYDSRYRLHDRQLTYRMRIGEETLVLNEHIERLIASQLPQLAFSEAERRRRRAVAHLSAALDAAQDGRTRATFAHTAKAVRADRAALANPRWVAAISTLALGGRGRRMLGRLRAGTRRREYLNG